MTVPDEGLVALFHSRAAHVGEVSIGGPDLGDLTHVADLVVSPGSVSAVFKKWAVRRPEDGLIVTQTVGPLRMRVGRFPPWQNTVIWVRQGQQLAMLRISGRQRRSLRSVLTATGFGVKEDRASLSHPIVYYEP